MIVLALRTDGPQSYIALFENQVLIGDIHWESGKELARDLLTQISIFLHNNHKTIDEIEGIACFAGPGSFTSLRIGITALNTLAYAKEIPIVSSRGEEWVRDCLRRLSEGENDKVIVPEYGSEPHITLPKK